VPYNITSWLEKNKDPLNDTVVDLFKKGTNELVKEIFSDHPGQSGAAGGDAGGKGTDSVLMRKTFKKLILIILWLTKQFIKHFTNRNSLFQHPFGNNNNYVRVN